MAADWIKIRNEYVNGSISYRKLSEKHDVSFATLQARGKKENWKKERDKQHDKIKTRVGQKTADVIVEKEVDRITRILSAADLLLTRVEEAAGQLDTHIVTNKTKTKTVKYNDGNKPTKEVVVEEELKAVVPGPVDRLGLQQVAAALKSIKETVRFSEDGQDAENHTEKMLALADVIRAPVENRNIEDFEE